MRPMPEPTSKPLTPHSLCLLFDGSQTAEQTDELLFLLTKRIGRCGIFRVVKIFVYDSASLSFSTKCAKPYAQLRRTELTGGRGGTGLPCLLPSELGRSLTGAGAACIN